MKTRPDLAFQNRSDLRHSRLNYHLYDVAKGLRQAEILDRKVPTLVKLLALVVPLCVLGYVFPSLAALSLYLVALAIIVALVLLWRHERRARLDYLAAAVEVEQENPSLNHALITAVEKNLSEPPNFFLDRVADKALSHPSRPEWSNAGRRKLTSSRIRYLGTLGLLLAVTFAAYFATYRSPVQRERPRPPALATGLAVAPGDAEVQRGSSLVITARFDGEPPTEATLVVRSDSGYERRSRMAQSFSDPVFATTLQRIGAGLRYRVEYAEGFSDEYRISVFDLPALARADATLDYPEYTKWEDRTIEDTTRISAIEGSSLQYFFNTNKPVKNAYLTEESGARIELKPANEERTRYVFSETLTTTARYTLHLLDEQGRANALPPEIRVDVLPNNRPSLRFETPRGDQRFSPIEEVAFKGVASDDFGLLDYGVAIVFGAGEPEVTSLKEPEQTEAQLNAELDMLLPLENYNLQPKDTLSWYLWADDYDAKGEPRRSTSDLFFADIRELDEIFREQDAGGAGQQGQGNPGQDLIDQQRRVSISLFRIKNTATSAEAATEDLDTAQRSQWEVQDRLRQLVPDLQDPAARKAATDALRFMEGTYVSLTTAIDEPTLETLGVAWSDSRGAYEELIKLTENEYNVSQSQNRGGSGNPGQSRNQAQLDQLEFQQNENRYETATEAQSLASPEERQNLELMAKLNELSRRQQDMNDRLQEMQNAMAEARSEDERERIRRELKRLEEEQRELLSAADEAIQRTGNRQSARETRQQLEEARDNMRRSSEQLEQGEVSQALASGTRAQDTIEQTRENMRQQTSSQFSEAMRKARSQARELAEQQRELERDLDELQTARSLDDSEKRSAVAEKLEAQAEEVSDFLEDLRQITEGAESAEAGLHRKLYQILRDANSAQFEERYGLSSQLLQQGFINDAQQNQEGVAETLDELDLRIAEAAEGILGDETTTLQFAQSELDTLSQQLEEEREEPASDEASRQGSENPSSAGRESAGSGQEARAGGASMEEMIRNALAGLERANASPLTGSGFSDWVERLNTVEALMVDPETRRRIAEARETAEALRRDFKRHGELPQWTMIEDGIAAPLRDVRNWLKEELNRRTSPDTLQRIDRDPVPEEYSEAVRRYYESLGEE